MSTPRIFLSALTLSASLCGASTAYAQTQTDVAQSDAEIAERMLGNNGRVTQDRSRRNCLKTIRQGEIVVCAPDEEEFRVPSTADEDPTGSAGTNDGSLRPPDVAGDGIFKGKATMGGMCIVPPCPPEQPYLIDLSSIPEAPEGSDADKIAKGEMRPH